MAKCECDKVSESPKYHGGETEQCPREATVYEDIITSPEYCTPCLFGCCE